LFTVAGGYVFDGATRPFDTSEETILVRQPDDTLAKEVLVVRRSVHGPIVGQRNGHPVALRMASLDASGLCQQWWDMGRAKNLREFEAALGRLQLPMFNVVYADRDGHILYVFNARVPAHDGGEWSQWSGVMPGDTSKTLALTTVPYAQLPRVLDPPSGWLQNSNDAPWTSTFPMVLDRASFPAYLMPQAPMSLRSQRSARMLAEAPPLSLDTVVQLKHSTRMELADRLVGDLVKAARASGSALAGRAAGVLESWDRNADAESRGAVLFERFVRLWERSAGTDQPSPFATPWTAAFPLDTPKGLADPSKAVSLLEAAALDVEKAYGAIDVRWGDVYRFRQDDLDLPGNGGPSGLGIFRVVNYAGDAGQPRRAIGGDSFVMAVQFGKTTEARALLGYGNASQPHSASRTNQLELMSAKMLRPVWRGREAVKAHLDARQVF